MYRIEVQIKTAAAFSCEFPISLESSFPFAFPPSFRAILPSSFFFFFPIFLAEIERDENCGLICGNAAIYRIHLVSYESRTIKSVILPESTSLREELCVWGTGTDSSSKLQIWRSLGECAWVHVHIPTAATRVLPRVLKSLPSALSGGVDSAEVAFCRSAPSSVEPRVSFGVLSSGLGEGTRKSLYLLLLLQCSGIPFLWPRLFSHSSPHGFARSRPSRLSISSTISTAEAVNCLPNVPFCKRASFWYVGP